MCKLECPFCNSELVQEGSNNYWCKKCNLERYSPALYGSQKLWQELIRTRKELDAALRCLNGVVKDLPWVKRTLDEIAALEQKEHFADVGKKIEQKDE